MSITFFPPFLFLGCGVLLYGNRYWIPVQLAALDGDSAEKLVQDDAVHHSVGEIVDHYGTLRPSEVSRVHCLRVERRTALQRCVRSQKTTSRSSGLGRG